LTNALQTLRPADPAASHAAHLKGHEGHHGGRCGQQADRAPLQKVGALPNRTWIEFEGHAIVQKAK
jgi:hypothetical protein